MIIDNDQDQSFILDIVQEVIPNQDNVIEPPVQAQQVVRVNMRK